MEAILPVIIGYLSSLTTQYPALVGILAIAYVIGLVLKTLRTAVKAFVLESPSKDDDIKLADFEQGKIGKVVYFLADLLIRFKK
jgi:hypothetical protein